MKYKAKETVNINNSDEIWIIKDKIYDIKDEGKTLVFKSEASDNNYLGVESLDEYFDKVEEKPRICEILGVEVGEKFLLRTAAGNMQLSSKYYINEFGKFLAADNDFSSPVICLDTINGHFKIVKIPKYTEEQKEIFKALKTLGFNWIVRDSDNSIYAYESKPKKYEYDWQSKDDVLIELSTSRILNASHLCFIEWENKEPFEIPEV